MRNIKACVTVLFFSLFVLVGCAQPTPVIIFVTPTPAQTEGAPTMVPTVDLGEVASATPVPFTSTPVVTPGPTVTFIGPIIGDDYTLPITNTPPPTTTPIVPTQSPVQPTELIPTSTTAPPTLPPPTRVGTPLPGLDTTSLGIQVESRVEQEDWNLIMKQVEEDLDMGWLKVQIAWSFFQPNGPDEISSEFRRLEIFLEQSRQIKQVKILVSIAKAPDWARSNQDEDGPPDDPQALANFISLVLREFGDSIDAVEVWNEPNLAREWRGHPLNGASYMTYFDAGYNAVRAYSPNIVVVSAGLAPTADTDSSRNDRAYLREMYNAGLARYTNIGVGVHPYGWGNPPDARCCAMDGERGWDDAPQFFFLNTLEDYRAIMQNYGHTSAQLWPTEFGWATWEGLPGDPPDGWMTYNDKWAQANYTLRAIEILQSLDYIGPAFLWNLNFAQPILIEQRDERVAYSIVLPEGAPRERPLYWMLYDAVRPDEELPRYD